MIPPPKLEGPLRDIGRFVFAASDMDQADAATEALAGERLNGHLCRALETAISTCYARPFTTSYGVGRLDRLEWGPEFDTPDWHLHDFLIRWRDRLYAHTDATIARQIFDVASHLGDGQHEYSEAWLPMDREMLGPIGELCRVQHARFKAEAGRIQAELIAAAA